VFYSLTGGLKATGKIAAAKDWLGNWQIERAALDQALPVVGERAGEGNERCEEIDAPTLEADIGALIREAGDTLRGPPADAPQANPTRSSDRLPEFESFPTDQIGITVPAASDRDRQIGTGRRDDDLRFHLILTTGVLLAVLGFAWLGGLSPYRFFSSSPSHKLLSSSSATNLGSEHETLRPANSSDVTPSTTGARNVVTPGPPRPSRGQESFHGAAQPAPAPTNPVSKIARQNLASAGPPEAAAQQRAKTLPGPRPAPTPETRPTTIPGWTVREVVGGSVVLDGPNGALKVTRGNSVPGLGSIDSIVRWGNRWIVATSRGLITTQ
jgi:hypothetical protein